MTLPPALRLGTARQGDTAMTADRLPTNRVSTVAPGWLADVPFAHRGLHTAGRQQNSVDAVAAAADAGYGIEIDIRRSRDGVPVVIHDAQVRTRSAADEQFGHKVSALTAAALNRHGVSRLADVLRAAASAPLMVEIKSARPTAGALEGAVAATMKSYPGPWCVASFNPVCLRWFRRHLPDVPRVLTAQPARRKGPIGVLARRLEQLRDVDRVAPVAVSYDLDGLPTPATDHWRRRGGLLIAWTAVGPAGVERARQVADNLIFEQARP